VSVDAYVRMKTGGMILSDGGGYDHVKGEMNPAIFDEFVGEVLDRDVSPVIWEPFAGHTGRSATQDFAVSIDGLTVVSFDLQPCDLRVRKADSTLEGPGRFVGGVLFHPSYYGSAPFSTNGDVASLLDEGDYKNALGRTVELVKRSLEPGGAVCAVGRDYRYGGRRIRLDEWYVDMFEGIGLELYAVWQSEPDVVLVFESR